MWVYLVLFVDKHCIVGGVTIVLQVLYVSNAMQVMYNNVSNTN